MLLHTDTDMAEADEIEMGRDFAFFEKSLAGLNADKGNSLPEVVHNTVVFLPFDSAEEVRIL